MKFHRKDIQKFKIENTENIEKMSSKKFDPKKLKKLNDPARKQFQDPDLIWKALNLKDPEVLIDIGAGTGFFAIPFSEKMGRGKVYACDISEEMVTWMQQNISGIRQVPIVPMLVAESKISLDSGVADLVYMVNLHHELERPLDTLSDALRLLKTGGKMMIIDWKNEETPGGPPLSIRIDVSMIENQLKKCGFAHISVHDILPYHCFITAEKS
ncbi:MAG: class I SAM-dependent methyltransferase [SAR324 cluster bacterium]|nr:class I SAM-dependent methyltransferase [SAR324 cluster bacterium]